MTTDTEALKALVAHATELQKQLDEGDGAYPQDYHDIFGKLEAALPALERMLASQTQSQTFGQDMVLVPREPTPDMVEAGMAHERDCSGTPFLANVYKAMVAAAPVASQMGEPLAWLVKNAPDTEGNDEPYTNWSRVKVLMDEGYEVIPLYAAPAAGMDAEEAAREIVARFRTGLMFLRFYKEGMNDALNGSVEGIAEIIRKHQGKQSAEDVAITVGGNGVATGVNPVLAAGMDKP